MKKNRGFSLIEMMVVVGIVAMVTGGGLVFFNRYDNIQKIRNTKQELVDNLILARSYAKSLQVPAGFNGPLNYVAVTLTNDGVLTAGVNGVGTTYFSKDISAKEVMVTTLNIQLAPYQGKLINTDGSSLPSDTLTSVSIKSINDQIDERQEVVINAFGIIDGK